MDPLILPCAARTPAYGEPVLHTRRTLTAVAAIVAAVVLSACSSTAATPNRADRTFLQDMISHHERAIATARIGITQAHDRRVRAFARRIVAEQTPELDKLRARVGADHFTVSAAAGTAMATNRITDGQLTALRALHGTAFDLRFLTLHIHSEQGAAAMARTELARGADTAALKVAKSIAGAPSSEIPELEALRAELE
jgi:uncharacterized protein (DUF305 family)